MYAGYVDGALLFAAGMPGYEIVDGTLHQADGECDSAEFRLPAINTMRDVPVKRASVISIRKDGAEMFRGSVADTGADLRGTRTYNVDGAMLWLGDIRKPPFVMTEDTVTYYITALLTQYNAACLAAKQIKLGTIDATLPKLAVEQTEYKTILDLLQEAMQQVGGMLRIRYADGDIYLDCIKSYANVCLQTVDINANLLSLEDKIDGADLITRVYPIGKDGLTIASVNGGAVYLVNSSAEALYGRIDGTLRVDTDDAAALKAAAASYLAQNCGLSRGIQVTAADLSAQDIAIESFAVGDNVRVISPPHGIDCTMRVSKLDTSLVGNRASMTIGGGGKTLTGSVASGGRSTSTSTGGAGVVVDDAVDAASTNPVQNRAIAAALAQKLGKADVADYIIAQGTTGVWTWRKWASGIAELWGIFSADSLVVDNAWGSVYYGTWMHLAVNKSGRKYPFAFMDAPVVIATPYSPSTDFWLLTDSQNNLGTPQTYAPAYACVLPASATITGPQIHYHVIGKYK